MAAHINIAEYLSEYPHYSSVFIFLTLIINGEFISLYNPI